MKVDSYLVGVKETKPLSVMVHVVADQAGTNYE